MNRVRIVAITAVVLGGVVIAGTKFQQAREAAAIAGASAPTIAMTDTAVTPPSLASVASSIGSPPSLITAPVAAPAETPAPTLMTASVLPGVAPMQTRLDNDQPMLPLLPPDAPTAPDLAPELTTEVAPELAPEVQAELQACAVWLVVTPAPSAMLETSVYAPCDAGAAVRLSHSGLDFDMRLGADGQLLVQLPALTPDAAVTLTFADGRTQSDQTQITDLDSVERVVLQWQAPIDLNLHAYEFGAQFGESGHVHAGTPNRLGIQGEGFLTALGDPTIPAAALAEVYSYPRGETPRSGRVVLEIEAPVTLESCGNPVTASTIEIRGIASAQIRNISLDMPACDGVGGFVILPDVLPELQIALN